MAEGREDGEDVFVMVASRGRAGGARPSDGEATEGWCARSIGMPTGERTSPVKRPTRCNPDMVGHER